MLKRILFQRQRPSARSLFLYYDADCGFCTMTARWLDRLDILGSLEFRTALDAGARHAGLRQYNLDQAVYLLTPAGTAYGGFYAVRQLALRLPLLWPLGPLLWIPGSAFFGVRLYRWVAEHRGGFSRCTGRSCQIPATRQVTTASTPDRPGLEGNP